MKPKAKTQRVKRTWKFHQEFINVDTGETILDSTTSIKVDGLQDLMNKLQMAFGPVRGYDREKQFYRFLTSDGIYIKVTLL